MGIKISSSFILALLVYVYGGESAIFTVKNKCEFNIWPATLTGTGAATIPTGFALAPNDSRSFYVPSPWSGRLWARFQCSSSSDNKFTCLSGDCNSGQIECKGAGGNPPASLVQFTLKGSNGLDFYDVSLVDGFNLPVSVVPEEAGCPVTSCPYNINSRCPFQLAVKSSLNGETVGCKSACVAFGEAQYCCTGEFGNPGACKPTVYSGIFKKLCSLAYSYAFDDQFTSFTCPTGGNYLITFCP